MQEDCVQVLLSLSHSPHGLHLLASSGCPLVAARALMSSGGSRASLKQLLLNSLSNSAVVARHRQAVEKAVALLASHFRASQARA